MRVYCIDNKSISELLLSIYSVIRSSLKFFRTPGYEVMANGEAYDLKFDPHEYLKFYTEVSPVHKFPLKVIHDMFQSYGTAPAGLKVLEFGSGPVPIYQCSTPLHASEVVFAEYTERNRKVLQKWLDKDPDAFDFTPFFKYVVQDLEGKGEDEVIKRQDELRALVKGVIPCDILSDPILTVPGYEGPYDVITSSFCLPGSVGSLEGFDEAIKKLTAYLRPGGVLLLNDAEGPSDKDRFYYVGNEKFPSIKITADFLRSVLENNGYRNITITRLAYDDANLMEVMKERCNIEARIVAVGVKI